MRRILRAAALIAAGACLASCSVSVRTGVVPHVPTTRPPAASKTLSQIVLRPEDVPSGFKLLTSTGPVPASELGGACGNGVWSSRTAGFTSEYSLDLQPDNSERGHLVDTAYQNKS